jgi:hypothetical protein
VSDITRALLNHNWESRAAAALEGTEEPETPQLVQQPQQPEEREQIIKIQYPAADPSQKECYEHQATHLPYRPWCKLCCQARGRDKPHAQVHRPADEMPRIELDYSFVKFNDEFKARPVLVMAYCQRQYGATHVVRAKGREEPRAAALVNKFIVECGLHGPVRIVTDKENPVIAVAQDVAHLRKNVVTIIDTVPRNSKGSVGSVDSFAQMAIGMARTICLDVEERWGTKTATNSPLVPWIVRHSAWLLNRYQPRTKAKGTTGFQQMRQQAYRGEITRFAAPVLGRRYDALQQGRLESRWMEGLWLGKTCNTDAHIIGTAKGVAVVRAMRPTVEKSALELNDMVYRPWHLQPETEQQPPDKEIQEEPPEEEEEEREDEDFKEPEEPSASSTARPKVLPRGDGGDAKGGGAFTERAKRLQQFQSEEGLTEGCKACERGNKGRQHSAVCRKKQIHWQNERDRKNTSKRMQDTQGAGAAIRRRITGKTTRMDAEEADQHKRSREETEGERELLEEEKQQELYRSHGEKRGREETELQRQLLEEEKQIGEQISFVQIHEPWIDPETGKSLDKKLVEVGQNVERTSFCQVRCDYQDHSSRLCQALAFRQEGEVGEERLGAESQARWESPSTHRSDGGQRWDTPRRELHADSTPGVTQDRHGKSHSSWMGDRAGRCECSLPACLCGPRWSDHRGGAADVGDRWSHHRRALADQASLVWLETVTQALQSTLR